MNNLYICVIAVSLASVVLGTSSRSPSPNLEGCLCPVGLKWYKTYCGWEIMDGNKGSENPVLQSDCQEDDVYYCERSKKPATLRIDCTSKGQKCTPGRDDLSPKYSNPLIAQQALRWCVDETDSIRYNSTTDE